MGYRTTRPAPRGSIDRPSDKTTCAPPTDIGTMIMLNHYHHHDRGGKLRDKATINRLKMYRGGKPIRDKKGKVRACVGPFRGVDDWLGGSCVCGSSTTPTTTAPLTPPHTPHQIVGGTLMMRDRAGDVAITAATGRIQPDRRWFGNTRIISQDDLDR